MGAWLLAAVAIVLLVASTYRLVRAVASAERSASTLRRRIVANGLWPLLPILAWNLVLTSRLPPAFFGGEVPGAVALVEGLGRAVVFIGAAFLVLRPEGRVGRGGLVLLVAGTLLYFGSWLPPLLDPTPSWWWLGPYLLPVLWLVGLGALGRSPPYVVGSLVFIAAHVTHGVLMLR